MIFDIVVIVILLLSALIAFLRGFIRELLTIIGVVGGVIAARYLGEAMAPSFGRLIGVDPQAEEPQRLFDIVPLPIVAQILSYGLVFIVVVIALSVLSHFFSSWAKAVGLGAIDRTLGVIFGLARGVLLLALLYLPVYFSVAEETRDEWFAGSQTRPLIELSSDAVLSFLPDQMEAQAKEQIEKSADTKAMIEGAQGHIERLTGGGDDGRQSPAEKDEANGTSEEPGYEDRSRRQLEDLIQQNSGRAE